MRQRLYCCGCCVETFIRTDNVVVDKLVLLVTSHTLYHDRYEQETFDEPMHHSKCQEQFTEKVYVTNHNHVKEKFRHALCKVFNVNLKQPGIIPYCTHPFLCS